MDEDLYQKIFKLAAKENAVYTDIRDEDTLYNSIEVVDGKVESSITGSEAGIGIRVLIDGSWGFAFGSKENYKDIFSMVINAQKTSKKLSKSEVKLADVKPINDKVVIGQKKKSQDISFEEKMNLVLTVDKSLKDEENKIKATRLMYFDSLRRQTIATSEGTMIYEERPYTFLYMIPTAKKGTDTNSAGARAGHVGGFDIFDEVDVLERAENAKIRAINGLEAKGVKPGRYPVVLDGTLNFLFAHEAAGHSTEGDFLRTAGVLRGKLQKRIASDFVNLIDDGSLEYVPGYTSRTFGFMHYDDEGVPVERTEIIKEGVLKTYLTDRASAAYFNLKPTGNCRAEFYSSIPIVRMRNTYLEASKGNDLKEEEVLSLIKNGLLLKYGGGGQVDPIRGTFNFGVGEVFEIHNGEIKDLRKATTLSGNTVETLNKIMGLSNKMADPSANVGFCGKDGQSAPTGTGAGWMAVKMMTVGG
ncbi:MAG TPA: TldD/PmbA family protein [candidate division Zixibacteria bacterium]|nr:TldD/PmbA family protein [candidate division Zixibacteria bacterium]